MGWFLIILGIVALAFAPADMGLANLALIVGLIWLIVR